MVALCGSILTILSSQGIWKEGIGYCLFSNTPHFIDCPCCYQGYRYHLVWYVNNERDAGVMRWHDPQLPQTHTLHTPWNTHSRPEYQPILLSWSEVMHLPLRQIMMIRMMMTVANNLNGSSSFTNRWTLDVERNVVLVNEYIKRLADIIDLCYE